MKRAGDGVDGVSRGVVVEYGDIPVATAWEKGVPVLEVLGPAGGGVPSSSTDEGLTLTPSARRRSSTESDCFPRGEAGVSVSVSTVALQWEVAARSDGKGLSGWEAWNSRLAASMSGPCFRSDDAATLVFTPVASTRRYWWPWPWRRQSTIVPSAFSGVPRGGPLAVFWRGMRLCRRWDAVMGEGVVRMSRRKETGSGYILLGSRYREDGPKDVRVYSLLCCFTGGKRSSSWKALFVRGFGIFAMFVGLWETPLAAATTNDKII